jgi:cob(I)alamin adenosyltransferase
VSLQLALQLVGGCALVTSTFAIITVCRTAEYRAAVMKSSELSGAAFVLFLGLLSWVLFIVGIFIEHQPGGYP